MEEKRISKAEFEAAVEQVMGDIIENPELDDGGMAKLIIPLIGMTFASQMKEILFSEDKERVSHGS